MALAPTSLPAIILSHDSVSTMFISYAQNFEDVMLWRALKDYPPGFYVDVGAHHPVILSVTKAFYDRGWRGINIEAAPEFLENLRQARPEDHNLGVFVGANDGLTRFFRIADTGLSTSRADIAEKHQAAGFSVEELWIPTRTLTSTLSDATVPNDRFHFLKVDVEGAEIDVLRGLDLEIFRPWILVVESTEPLDPTPNHEEFEELILAHRYDFVYFDGLNRYYVAHERSELKEAFTVPPNVFDNFTLWNTVSAERERDTNHAECRSARAETASARAETASARAETASARAETASARAECDSNRAECQQLGAKLKKLDKMLNKLRSDIDSMSMQFDKVSERLKSLYGTSRWKAGGWMTLPFSRRRMQGYPPLDSALKNLSGRIRKAVDTSRPLDD